MEGSVVDSYNEQKILFEKEVFNGLIFVLLEKSGFQLDDVHKFILLHKDTLTTEHVGREKEEIIDTTELYNEIFGEGINSKSDQFHQNFIFWYTHIYDTHLGDIIKIILITYENNEIVKIFLSIIDKFEIFVKNKQSSDRITLLNNGGRKMFGGQSSTAFVQVILLLISCLVVFAPSGDRFMPKTEVERLVNHRISDTSKQLQISDKIISNKVATLLQEHLFTDITSFTGVKVDDYFDYWKIDDGKMRYFLDNTKVALESFSNITEMVSEYIENPTGKGILSEYVPTSFIPTSVFTFLDPRVKELKESIQKTTKDMNKIITIVTMITRTIEEIGKTVNPTIKNSVELFLHLIEPTITERYINTENNYKVGGLNRRKGKQPQLELLRSSYGGSRNCAVLRSKTSQFLQSVKIFKNKKGSKNKKFLRKRKQTIKKRKKSVR